MLGCALLLIPGAVAAQTKLEDDVDQAVTILERFREIPEQAIPEAGMLLIDGALVDGFVVLVGLACKNAILIVEFARDRQQEGASRFDAAVEAARVRLRPIIMTSFAFILGVFPLVIAQGAGAEMRRTLGTAVFAGMIGVTLFGIFLTPVFYSVVRRLSDRGPVTPALARGPGPFQEAMP